MKRIGWIALWFCALLHAQSVVRRPEFIVEVIKPSGGAQGYGQKGGPGTDNPGLYRIANMEFDFWVQIAYQKFDDEYSGPGWMHKAKFDLTAKVPPGATRDQLHQMLQVVIEKRFKLHYHLSKKEVAAYRLVVAKGGIKLKVSSPSVAAEPDVPWEPPSKMPKRDEDGFPIIPEQKGKFSIMDVGSSYTIGYGQTIAQIVGAIGGGVGRRIIDETGLKGFYDFKLVYSTALSPNLPPEARPDVSDPPDGMPSVFRAVEKQLGLHLEPTKTIVDVLVVDSIERTPTAN
jgi:uncharacterized protein (TIGR03435 family)